MLGETDKYVAAASLARKSGLIAMIGMELFALLALTIEVFGKVFVESVAGTRGTSIIIFFLSTI